MDIHFTIKGKENLVSDSLDGQDHVWWDYTRRASQSQSGWSYVSSDIMLELIVLLPTGRDR